MTLRPPGNGYVLVQSVREHCNPAAAVDQGLSEQDHRKPETEAQEVAASGGAKQLLSR